MAKLSGDELVNMKALVAALSLGLAGCASTSIEQYKDDKPALDPVSLVGSEHVVMTVGAVKAVEEWLA